MHKTCSGVKDERFLIFYIIEGQAENKTRLKGKINFHKRSRAPVAD